MPADLRNACFGFPVPDQPPSSGPAQDCITDKIEEFRGELASRSTSPAERDQALLLIGFAGALRHSELVALDIERLTWSDDGVKLLLEKSKTDKEGEGAEVMIAFGHHETTCPVRALKGWLEAATIKFGPVFRKVNKAGRVEARRLSEDAVRQILSVVPRRPASRARWPNSQSAWAARGVRDDGLPERGLRRGDHGPHAPSEPDHHAKLRSESQAQPDHPSGQAGSLI